MKSLAFLAVSVIIAFSSFSQVFGLPRSLESYRRWLFTRSFDLSPSLLSKRSTSQGESICLKSRRPVLRSTSGTEKDDEKMDPSCGKATESTDIDDSSLSSPKATGETAPHSSKAKVLASKSHSHSFSQRSSESSLESWSESTLSSKSYQKSGYHSKKKKLHHSHHKEQSAASYGSPKKSASTQASTGNVVKNTGSYANYDGASWNHGSSHSKATTSSTNKDGSQANNGENETSRVVNDAGNAWDNTVGSLNNAVGPVGHTGSQEQDGSNGGYQASNNAHQGKATFFLQGGSPGACGKVHPDSAFIVAIQTSMYDGGKHCGKTVMITRKSTGKSIKAVAADECPGCPTHQSLDLSVGAFNALGSPDEGVFDIDWRIVDE